MILVFCVQLTSAKEITYIVFQKKQSKRTIRFKLPLKCRIYESKEEKRFGKITDYTDTSITFEYKDYDTSEVNKIMAIDTLSRKEKFDLIDTMIQKSVYTKIIAADSIYKISVLSGSYNLGRELAMLGSSILFMGSGISLLIDTSDNVGKKLEWWNWMQIAGMGTGAGLLTALMKRNIYFDKWRLTKSKT